MEWNSRVFLSEHQIGRLEAEALRLLHETGIRIESSVGLAALGQRLRGVSPSDIWLDNGRLCFAPEYIRQWVPTNRAMLKPAAPRERFSIGVCDMPQYYLEPGAGVSVPMTVKNLVEATQFLDVCAKRYPGAWPMVPGVPRDVPMQMQALTELMIGAVHCRNGGNLDTFGPEAAEPWIVRFLEAMGGGLTSVGMFTVSPMKLGGFEFDAAVRHMDLCERFHISSLPIPGMSAPVHLRPAWAVSIAEALGGAATLSLLSGGKPVSISVGMFPYDVRHAWVAGGTPEHMVMEAQRAQITRRYDPGIVYSHSMTTSARTVGAQAGAEKAAGAQAAALLGCRDFNTAGLLGFDDIFSPAQFLLDIEILRLIEANTVPVPDPPEESWRAIIAEGVEKGYVDADETLFRYRDAQYVPDLFDRRGFAAALRDPAGSDWALRRTEALAREYVRQHERYAPKGIEEAKRIYHDAWKALAGGEPAVSI